MIPPSATLGDGRHLTRITGACRTGPTLGRGQLLELDDELCELIYE